MGLEALSDEDWKSRIIEAAGGLAVIQAEGEPAARRGAAIVGANYKYVPRILEEIGIVQPSVESAEPIPNETLETQ